MTDAKTTKTDSPAKADAPPKTVPVTVNLAAVHPTIVNPVVIDGVTYTPGETYDVDPALLERHDHAGVPYLVQT